MVRVRRIPLVFTLSIIVGVTGCGGESSTGPGDEILERGEIILHNSIYTVTADSISDIMGEFWFELPFGFSYDVECVRIVYQTEDPHGNRVRASGTFLIPQGADNLPIFNYNHSTITRRDEIYLTDPFEENEGDALIAVAAAAVGYLVCAPDYLGYGISEVLHPYHHAESATTNVVDLLRAAQSYCSDNGITLSGQLFLAGFIEGGYVSLAAHRGIEQDYASEFTVTASCPAAGVYDLKSTFAQFLQDPIYPFTSLVAFQLVAYNDIYEWHRLDEIFRGQYASITPNLFDGTREHWYILNQLPSTVQGMLTEAFVDGYLDGSETTVIAAFEENSPINWAPAAPIRIYHGTNDELSPFDAAQAAADSLAANGGATVEFISIPGATQDGTALEAFVGMLLYFNDFAGISP